MLVYLFCFVACLFSENVFGLLSLNCGVGRSFGVYMLTYEECLPRPESPLRYFNFRALFRSSYSFMSCSSGLKFVFVLGISTELNREFSVALEARFECIGYMCWVGVTATSVYPPFLLPVTGF